MRTSSAPLRIKVLVLCMLAFAGLGAMNRSVSADEALARRTAPGHEVLVREFAEFDGDCARPVPQTISVVEVPTHGRVEQRPASVTVGADGVGKPACRGRTVDGVQVFYVPEAGFVGRDRFALDVAHAGRRSARAKVDVTVGGEARTAAN